jgi:hypothetical protein
MGQVRHTQSSLAKEDVKLVIQERFLDLIPLEMLVFDTGLVMPHPFNNHLSFSFGKGTGVDRRVWEEDEYDDTPCRTESAATKSQFFGSSGDTP